MTNLNTLDPNEIRKLPMRRDLPYNGLTREQVVTIGGDPEAVEAARISSNEQARDKATNENEQILYAAETAVENGDLTAVEAAAVLAANGHLASHQVFVDRQIEREAAETAEAGAEWLAAAPMQDYVELLDQEREQARAQADQAARDAADELARAQLAEFKQHFREHLSSTPLAHVGADRLADALERKIVENNGIPGDKQRFIDQTAREIDVLDVERESVMQQVETEWRILRTPEYAARDGLNTVADIARAETAFKTARFEELASARTLDKSALELPPTPAEITAGERAKYEARERQSVDFQTSVHAMGERGRAASGGDRGDEITQREKGYREALKRAEDTAAFGEFASVRSGYGDNAVQPEAKGGQLDEYGSAFPGFD